MKPETLLFMLSVAFVVGVTLNLSRLKLDGIITCSWWSVFSPILAYAALYLIAFIVALVVFDRKHRKH